MISGDWGQDDLEIFATIFEQLLEVMTYHRIQKEYDFVQPHRFYDKLLVALALHYGEEWFDHKEETLRSVMLAIVDECAERPGTNLNRTLAEFTD